MSIEAAFSLWMIALIVECVIACEVVLHRYGVHFYDAKPMVFTFPQCPHCRHYVREDEFDAHVLDCASEPVAERVAASAFVEFVNTLPIAMDDTQPIFWRTPDGK